MLYAEAVGVRPHTLLIGNFFLASAAPSKLEQGNLEKVVSVKKNPKTQEVLSFQHAPLHADSTPGE